MSGKHIAKEQPKSFIFSEINLKKKDEILKKYPEQRKKSAVMPLLYLAQKQNDGWIPLAGIQYIADLLEVPYIKVFEVATFYTMYNTHPDNNTPRMLIKIKFFIRITFKSINE